jgi:tripartite motif-containing protein 71
MGTEGTGDGEFNQRLSIAVASDGSVYVADTDSDRIQKFTSEGEFVCKWGTRGTGDGDFFYPRDVAVASDGSLYVADWYNHRIQKFTSEGVFVSQWGTQGAGEGEFFGTAGVAVASDGSVYVTDRSSRSSPPKACSLANGARMAHLTGTSTNRMALQWHQTAASTF